MMNRAVTPSRPSPTIVSRQTIFSFPRRSTACRASRSSGSPKGWSTLLRVWGAERLMGSESAATDPTCVWITPSWRRAIRLSSSRVRPSMRRFSFLASS